MSGPKCSQLDIERQTRERIDAIRKRLTDAIAQSICELKALEQESRSYARSHSGLDDAFRDMERIIDEAVSDVRSIGRFEMGSDIPAAERYLKDAEGRMRAVVTGARRAMAPHVERIRLSRSSDSDRRSVSEFSKAIASNGAASDVTAALDALLAAPHGARQAATQSPSSTVGPSASAEMISELEGVLRDVRLLVSRSQTLESDRTALSAIAHAVRKTSESARMAGRTLTSAEAEGLLAQAKTIRSRISSQEASITKALARIDALESLLGSAAGTRPPSFKNADAVFARLDALEAIVRANDERRYIRACIDDVMRKHGYDVVRSVELSETAPDGHFLFTNSNGKSDAETGIHAFIADSGDMMLEVVGVSQDGDARRDRMDAVSDAAQQNDLMAAQTRFCSVYAEIEEDLAHLGIVNKVRHKAPPDVRHCKRIRLAASKRNASVDARSIRPGSNIKAKSGETSQPAAKTSAGAEDGRRVNTDANFVRRSTARRRAEAPHARKMR